MKVYILKNKKNGLVHKTVFECFDEAEEKRNTLKGNWIIIPADFVTNDDMEEYEDVDDEYDMDDVVDILESVRCGIEEINELVEDMSELAKDAIDEIEEAIDMIMEQT